MVNVVIADDHEIVRSGLRLLLESWPECAVIGEASDGDEAMEQVQLRRPDLLLSDLKMPGTPIIEGVARMKHDHPALKVVILTAVDESEDIYLARKAGVDGYLMKDTGPEEILSAISSVLTGGSYYQPTDSRARVQGESPYERG